MWEYTLGMVESGNGLVLEWFNLGMVESGNCESGKMVESWNGEIRNGGIWEWYNLGTDEPGNG